MTNLPGATSTIAALCYATTPSIDFEMLVTELGSALGSGTDREIRTEGDSEDIAIFDLGCVRIGLALCKFDPKASNGNQHAYATSLIISIGSSLGQSGCGPLFDQRQEMRDGLAERINALHPADTIQRLDVEDVFTDTCLAQLADKIWPTNVASSLPVAELEFTHQEFPTIMSTDTYTTAPVAIAAHQGRTMTPRVVAIHPTRRSAPIAANAAKSPLPRHPSPKRDRRPKRPALCRLSQFSADSARIRMALYLEPEVETTQVQSTQRRATVYAISSTVMVFSLPVGAAMMTYAMLGRENLGVAARSLALTGTLIGLGQSAAAQQLISVFS